MIRKITFAILVSSFGAAISSHADSLRLTDVNYLGGTSSLGTITSSGTADATIYTFSGLDFDGDMIEDSISFGINVTSNIVDPVTFDNLRNRYNENMNGTGKSFTFTYAGLINATLSGGGTLSGETFDFNLGRINGFQANSDILSVTDENGTITGIVANKFAIAGEFFTITNEQGAFRANRFDLTLDLGSTKIYTIPEPNTYASIGGFCALGFVVLRRRS